MNFPRTAKVVALHAKYVAQRRLAPPSTLRMLHYQMRNWGDSINHVFPSFFTDRKVVSVDIDARARFPRSYHGTLHLGIGSILHHADSETVVWGSGLQEPLTLRASPREIRAVRGPLTHQALSDQGIHCPKVFGDPVLLLPEFYRPAGEKKYALGLVSHIKDVNSPAFSQLRRDANVKFISMRGGGLGLVDELSECDAIASTSLHGLVLADAYGIPAVWVKVSDLIPGKDFKFQDYHQSLSASIKGPFVVDSGTRLRDIRSACRVRPLDLDLDALRAACPYDSV